MVCPLCGVQQCNRHNSDFQDHPVPELSILINEALELFATNLFKEYVLRWYSDISDDTFFIEDVRCLIGLAVTRFIERIHAVDITNFILDRLLAVICYHLQQQLEPENIGFEHFSINRIDELTYLRGVCQILLSELLPSYMNVCNASKAFLSEASASLILLPAMDIVADPNTVNFLLNLYFKEAEPLNEIPLEETQVVMSNFFYRSVSKPPVYTLQINDILGNPLNLYPFMQYMKKHGGVHILNLYMSTDELLKNLQNEKPMGLSLDSTTILNDFKEIYRNYLRPSGLERKRFSDQLVSDLERDTQSITDLDVLRSSHAIYQLHEEACRLLSEKYLPDFRQNECYFKLICGDRCPTLVNRSRLRGDKSLIKRIGLRIQEKLKKTFAEDLMVEEIDLAGCADELIDSNEEDSTYSPPAYIRDLGNWRVSLPRLEVQPDPDNHKKSIFVFVIVINRVSVCAENDEKSCWSVTRRYHEFYILEQKLTEFHGDLPSKLPFKKSFGFGARTQEFMESMQHTFEQYLQSLLVCDQLQNSELLHSFLTTDHEFTRTFLSHIGVNRVINKVQTVRLTKERGQHLEQFLHDFEKSIEPKPPPLRVYFTPTEFNELPPSVAERYLNNPDFITPKSADFSNYTEQNDAQSLNKHVSSSLPNNGTKLFDEGNESVSDGCTVIADSISSDEDSLDIFKPRLPVSFCPALDLVIFIARSVLRLRSYVVYLLVAIRALFGSLVQSLLYRYLRYRLQSTVLQPQRIASVIRNLQEAISSPSVSSNEKEMQKRKEQAFDSVSTFLPEPLVRIIGQESHDNGVRKLFNLFQQPRLNKQLSYVLLDALLCELYPHLFTASPETGDKDNIEQNLNSFKPNVIPVN